MMKVMIECQSCRAGSQLYLCADCLDALDEAIGQIPELLSELEVTISRLDRLNTGAIGRSALVPSPINFGASRLLSDITDMLVDLVDTLCATNAVQFFPALSVGCYFIGPLRPGWQRLPKGYSGSPTQRARWVRHHIELIAKHPKAGEMFDAITEYTGDRNHPSKQGRLWQAIGRQVHQFAGFCPTPIGRDQHGDVVECGTTLYSEDEDSEETDCPKCLATIDVPRNRQRAIMSRDLLPEARILAVMADLGESLCKERLYGWLRTGRLSARGYLHDCQIVEHRVTGRDARLLSLSTVRQLRWAEEMEKAVV